MLKKNYDASGVPYVTWYDPVKHRKVERYLFDFAPYADIDKEDYEFLNLKIDPDDRDVYVVFGEFGNPNTWFNYMNVDDIIDLEDILREYEKSLEEDAPAEEGESDEDKDESDEEDEEKDEAEDGKDSLKGDSFIEIAQRFSNIALEFSKIAEMFSKLY